MTFERQFVLAGRGLAAIGTLALAITGEVGIVYLVLALGSLGWTAWRGWHGQDHGLHSGLANLTTLAAMALIFAPVVLRGAQPIGAIAEFLLVLMAIRSLAARTNADWFQIYALSFFQLVAASALTVEPSFALLFLAYLLLAPWALVLFHVRRAMTESGQESRLAREPFVDPTLFRGVASVTFVLFVSTIVVFVFFPRMGAGFFASPLGGGASLTGFSDEVGLGDVTALKSDDTVALRVSVDRPGRLSYFRGAALDAFDGRRWSRGRGSLRPFTKRAPGVFFHPRGRRGPLVEQEIILEPMEGSNLFFAGTPVEVHGRFSAVLMDGLGNVRMAPGTGVRLRYFVVSSLSPRTDIPTPRSRKLPAIDRRILETARARVAGLSGGAERAEALLAYFRQGFEYTTSPGDPGSNDPLAWFLFETRRGHCEYFASSLAVMLRAVGIPSIVVNGYHVGEWNPYGGYLVFRQSDAHSWVEAWIDGSWRTLDPTPGGAGPPTTRFQGLGGLIDAYRMRWYRYVINYNLEDQVGLAFALRDSSRSLWRGFTGEWWQRLRGALQGRRSGGSIGWAALLALLAVAALAALAWRRVRRRQAERHDSWASRRYLRCLKLLERRGLHKRPAETADEFYRKIAADLDGEREVVERLTALYQEERFSGRARPGSRAEIDALLERLEQHP